jgi:N-acylneuraminate cytidylyltransferase/CMP-N,N'-diacetyllegionaminic acid synthase
MLEPTSPLTKGEDIDLACGYMEQFGASSAVALRRVKEASPSRLLVLTEAARVKPAVRGDSYPLQGRRQDIEPYFLLAGSYYLSKVQAYIQHQSFLHKATLGIELPPWKTLEIDEEFDFFLAEQVVRSWVATHDV